MSEQEIFEKLKSIVVEQLGAEEESIKMEATFVDDLAADSLDIVELIMQIEEEFDMEIPDADAEKIVTVGNVVEYIKRKQIQLHLKPNHSQIMLLSTSFSQIRHNNKI